MKIRTLLESEDFNKKYEIMWVYLSAKMESLIKEALSILEKATDSGIIYNVTFNDIKNTLSRALERSLEAIENRKDREDL